MVIYTKRGDKGETSMFDETSAQRAKVPKDSLVVEALGAIDELNSFLGIVKANTKDKSLISNLSEIQKNLLTIGSITGGSNLKFTLDHTKRLEKLIDELEGTLAVLKNFVIPGGDLAAAQLQFARSLSRRAERRMVALLDETHVLPQILEYLNRLSDALFMLARKQNSKAGFKDDIWLGRKRK